MEVWRPSPVKILLINYEYPPFGGGAGNATQEIGRALAKMGHAVTVLTGGKGDPYSDPDGICVVPVGSARKHLSQASFKEMFSFLLLGVFWALGRRHHDFDLAIVFFALPCGPIATLLKKRWHVPYAVSLRGGDVPGLVPAIKSIHRFLTPLRRWVNKNAKAVVANSSSLAELAQAADPISVTVIPNGIDTDRYYPGAQKEGITNEPLQLLVVGRFHRQKMIPETIRCLAQARRRGINYFLSIIGDGPERDVVNATILEENMVEVVSLKGWLGKDELLQQYQQADCYLNLSSYEGMPNTVLEAMSCGLPIIASDIPPHQSLVKNEVTGYLVDLDQLDNLGCRLAELAADGHRARLMGAAARERALTCYSWTAVARDYLSLFD